MHKYWAKFKKDDDYKFRYDTRIYLRDIAEPEKGDCCVGAVVGKNPGSAVTDRYDLTFRPIDLKNDKLLPTVRSIVSQAYKAAGIEPPERGYIQVLNLFYLCDPLLNSAISTIENIKTPELCSSEYGQFPWVWYVWGGKNARLDSYKERFATI